MKIATEANRSTLDDFTSQPTNMQTIRLLNNFSGNELSLDGDNGLNQAMPVVYKKNGRVHLNASQLPNVQQSYAAYQESTIDPVTILSLDAHSVGGVISAKNRRIRSGQRSKNSSVTLQPGIRPSTTRATTKIEMFKDQINLGIGNSRAAAMKFNTLTPTAQQ